MGLQRKLIRKHIKKVLFGQTKAGSRVTSNRSETNWQENLPAINLYYQGEPTIEEISQAPRMLKRLINLEVEIIAEGRDDEEVSDNLDDLSEEIEICLSKDDSLDNLVSDIILSSVSQVDISSDGSKPTGSLKLRFDVFYTECSPRDIRDQITLQELDTIGAEYNLNSDQDVADRAIDTVTIP